MITDTYSGRVVLTRGSTQRRPNTPLEVTYPVRKQYSHTTFKGLLTPPRLNWTDQVSSVQFSPLAAVWMGLDDSPALWTFPTMAFDTSPSNIRRPCRAGYGVVVGLSVEQGVGADEHDRLIQWRGTVIDGTKDVGTEKLENAAFHITNSISEPLSTLCSVNTDNYNRLISYSQSN